MLSIIFEIFDGFWSTKTLARFLLYINQDLLDQELEIVEVHQESQNPGMSQSGLNSTINIFGVMDQTEVPNPLEEYQNRQKCHNIQKLTNLHVPTSKEDPDEIVCVQRDTIISD